VRRQVRSAQRHTTPLKGMLSVLLRPLKDHTQLHQTFIAAAGVGATRGKKSLNKPASDAAAGQSYMGCRPQDQQASWSSARHSPKRPADSLQCAAEAEKKRRRRAEKARLRAWTAEASWNIREEDLHDSQPQQVAPSPSRATMFANVLWSLINRVGC
jgi:hypothetical protein